MTVVICGICSDEFYAKPSQLRLGNGKFCSLKCKRDAQKTGRYVTCHVCNKEIWRTPKDILKSASGYFFCSKNCSMGWKNGKLAGKRHYMWRGGTSIYRRLKLENSDRIECAHCKIDDQRVIVVHHKDHNRKNNQLDNLELLCRNCHYLVHDGKTA